MSYELVIDNFAGGGGASTGIEQAIGRSVDIAINHDEAAIAMHKVNHPGTKHYCEDVWDVDPVEACEGRPVALAWFSPDCKHFSKAKGGYPKDKKIRGLAWLAVKWAKAVRPRIIMLENVEEFKTWGPLHDNGTVIKDRKGETFKSFIDALETCGYEVDHRELRACDYGAPTTRKRFFLIARSDGIPIVWPESTHGDPSSIEVIRGNLKPWRTAAEIIDWSIPCPSIFTRKKPLAENTMRRIARGIKKFIIDNPSPFIVPIGYGERKGQLPRVNSIDKPLGTIVATPKHYLCAPFLAKYHTETRKREVRGQELDKPIATLDGSNRFGLVTAFISKYYAGNYNGAGSSLNEPLHTVTAVDHNSLAVAYIERQFKSSVGHAMEVPLGTITAVNKSRLVEAFLVKYYSSDVGQKITDPMHTITSKDRFGLVTIENEKYQIVDIGLRMLQPHELYAAQGFPVDYIINRDIHGNKITKTNQVAKCGNSVSPPVAKALVEANLQELCYVEQQRYAD